MQEHVHVAHHVPGRVRIRVSRLKGNPRARHQVVELGKSIPGVHSVEANPTTGSVVFHYDWRDPEVWERLANAIDHLGSLLSAALPEASEAEEAIEEAAPAVAAIAGSLSATRPVFALLQSSDLKVKEASGGAVDLRTLLPLLLAVTVLFLDTRSKPLIAGTLVLMSLHSYAALHNPAPHAVAHG